jgi:hypothetical protein
MKIRKGTWKVMENPRNEEDSLIDWGDLFI